jgi:hypothetical protein
LRISSISARLRADPAASSSLGIEARDRLAVPRNHDRFAALDLVEQVRRTALSP